MRIAYCRRWSFTRQQPIDEALEGEARALNDAGEVSAVALGGPVDPDVVIDVAWENQFVGVWFFDQEGRRSLKYGFYRHLAYGEMFLDHMKRWQYPDTEARRLNQSELIETFGFQPDGVVRHEVRDFRIDERHVVDKHSVDVSINWEPVPEFGDWASIARYDRDSPPGHNGNVA